MKNLKLIFGLLLVAGFVATIALSSSSDDQAVRKRPGMILPTNG